MFNLKHLPNTVYHIYNKVIYLNTHIFNTLEFESFMKI